MTTRSAPGGGVTGQLLVFGVVGAATTVVHLGGFVLVRGRRCRVLGRVTMDQMLVDVSRLRGLMAGEEVVLIGRQRRDEITATELAGWAETIPWEILTAITARVPRLYRGGEAS